jgi:Asp-tRNA(Asn)/Glu-tRNA(Gln) amidotransferase A subunit family amidase
MPRREKTFHSNHAHGLRRLAWSVVCVGGVLALAAAFDLKNVSFRIRPVAAQESGAQGAAEFHLQEATIETIQQAIRARRLTATQLVHLYLNRIRAYNGVCVDQADGPLGYITPIPRAGQINALMTLNLRPRTRAALGVADRHARSMTDLVDNDPAMPDALEVAARLDAEFARTGELVGPLHGVVLSIKDQYDTADMRSTSGQDAFFANDRPPDDATFIRKLREAGAIVLAKANLGEGGSQRSRSSFGGTMCNPYDTTRSPGSSSGGSGSSVAANLVTCAIGEETGGSILHPARNANAVGLAPTQQLVSQDGMIIKGFNHRVGPICRTVRDAARILQVIAGYDPGDEITAFSVGRLPSQPYSTFANERRLDGLRIGVVREFMDKDLFTEAAHESIDIADRAIADLRGLGATIVDPGPHGALFQGCVDKYIPLYRNRLFTGQFPALFPAGADHVPLLVDMFVDPSRVPDGPNIRNLGPNPNAGEGKFFLSLYLEERGDANIRTISDLIEKANFFTDIRPGSDFTSYKEQLQNLNTAATLDLANLFQNRLAYQTIVLQCMGMLNLDAVTYSSGISVAPILGAPTEPSRNNSPNANSIWGVIAGNGFPALNVPAGFTTHVFDRVRDDAAPGGTRLVGPVPAALPVAITFLARPFDEPTLFRIASAYEAATRHRTPPRDFGPLPGEP